MPLRPPSPSDLSFYLRAYQQTPPLLPAAVSDVRQAFLVLLAEEELEEWEILRSRRRFTVAISHLNG
jgi:hypothetical protein